MNSVCVGCKHNKEGCLKNRQPSKYGCFYYSKNKTKKNKSEVLEGIGELIILLIEVFLDIII